MVKKAKSKHASTPPDVRILVVCDGAARDPNSRKITLYGLFDRWLIEKTPANVPFTAFAKLVGGRGAHTLQLEFLDPNGKVVEKNIPTLDVQCAPDRSGEIVVQGVLALRRFGKYTLRLKCGGKTIGHPCEITAMRKSQEEKSDSEKI